MHDLSEFHEGRRRFLLLVEAVRPDLHRYCARMTGSVADGEDIVQDTLARAYYALAELDEVPPLRPWLFRIAHNRAVDHLRRYDRRMGEPLDPGDTSVADVGPDPEHQLAQDEAVRLAIVRFVDLAPAQRSAVILKDVLGHSLDEIALLLDLTVPAVKAALHRGRSRLAELRDASPEGPPVVRSPSPVLARYTALFGARDWDGVRALLADDVRLDLVTRAQRAGRRDVGAYFTNYEAKTDWHLVPAWLDDHEVIAVFRNPADARPDYFVELTHVDGKITAIRDFRYVPYIAVDARFVIP